jgi:hypothetical protein
MMNILINMYLLLVTTCSLMKQYDNSFKEVKDVAETMLLYYAKLILHEINFHRLPLRE